MRNEVREAIESARSIRATPSFNLSASPRRASFGAVRSIVLAVVQELPADMTLLELIDELSIANSQDEGLRR